MMVVAESSAREISGVSVIIRRVGGTGTIVGGGEAF